MPGKSTSPFSSSPATHAEAPGAAPAPPQPPTSPARKTMLGEHKGKLAIGVAATLGVMIYYNWRQKRLPSEDPEAYARLQRFREYVKTHQADLQAEGGDATRVPAPDAQSMIP